MLLFKHFRKFGASEDGAVTVDWVVLTALICSLIMVAMAGLRGNMTSVGERVGNQLSTTSINTTF